MSMHKVFISYHHENDQSYKDDLVTLAEENQIFIDMSVDTGDISDDLPDESIREKIRDEYLRNSTVTIVLVGTETKRRKHVDWEIYSSMYDGAINKKSGIVVIMLPDTDTNHINAPHGQVEKDLYRNGEWTSVDSRAEYERIYPLMPDRLIDNLVKDKGKVSVVPWDEVDETVLKTLVEVAFNDRANCEYDLSQPMRRANS